MNFIKSKIFKSLGLASSIGIAIFAYQNCGKAGFDGALNSDSLGSVDKAVAGAPFAFKASIDQIAYNSCAGQGLSQLAGFSSMSYGSYGANSGLSIKSDILSYAHDSLKIIYPNPDITKTQVKTLIAGSPANKNMQLQLAFRSLGLLTTSDPNVHFQLSNLVDDRWLDPLVPDNISDYWANPDPAKLPLVNYFTHSPTVGQSKIEGKFNFGNTNYFSSSKFRTDVAGGSDANYGLVMGFSDPAKNNSQLAGLSPDATTAEAVAFKFGFEQAPNSYRANSSNILKTVEEIDLRSSGNQNSAAAWSCDIQVVVVDQKDALNRTDVYSGQQLDGECPKNDLTYFDSNPGLKEKYVTIKNSLHGDLWEVNYNTIRQRFCAVSKVSNSCYGTKISNKLLRVEYAPSTSCYEPVFSDDATMQSAYNLRSFGNNSDGSAQYFSLNTPANSTPIALWMPDTCSATSCEVKQCAQYISICRRN